MNHFNLGIISGIIFGVLILAIARWFRKRRGERILQEYDERQLQARSSAYATAFMVVLILICIDGLIKLAGITWYEEPFGEFAAIMIGLIVFAYKAVMNDAFLGNNEEAGGKNFKLLYLLVGFSQATIGLTSLDEMVADGIITMHALCLVTGLTFLSVAAMMIYHERCQKAEEEE